MAKWKHILPPQIDRNAAWGDVLPRDKPYGPLDWNSDVPTPTRDPRKSFAMPAAQGLDLPPAAAAPAAPQNVKVETNVTGQATVDFQVQPSGELISIAQQAKQATIELKAGLSALGAAITSANRSSRMGNGPGSTGVSSPDARPNTGIGGQ